MTEIYDEIQMERLTEGLSNSSEQDNQSTYQELVKIRGEFVLIMCIMIALTKG